MMRIPTNRRRFLKLAVGAGAASGTILPGAQLARATTASPGIAARLADHRIEIEFDQQMRARIWHLPADANQPKLALNHWDSCDFLLLDGGAPIDRFALNEHSFEAINGPLGSGTRLRLIGVADARIEKTLEVELLENFPGLAIWRVHYRNLAASAVTIHGWTNCSLHLMQPEHTGSTGAEPAFWSYCGSTHEDRRDWVQPVKPGFAQDNFMGMSASDYGGGTPIVDVWHRHAGIAIGHLETTQKAVSLPLERTDAGISLSISAKLKQPLSAGETFAVHETFLATHTGDYFAVLDTYRRIMNARGLVSPQPPEAAYEPIWCAWGYERDCTLSLIEGTLPKVQELGLRWAVIDDGWQNNVGDWKVNLERYPRGDADMKLLIEHIRARDLKPRLWWAPLAAAPGSDLLHDHTDMLLLDKDGAVQNISWWNSFYLCPAYQPTIHYTLGLVRKFLGEWGYAGLKIDGQHLNAVAPCFNPAHNHSRPEESVEKLQDFFLAIYQLATQINPQAVVELCPCGTSYSFFNLRSLNQAPASDPESSWQVRHKGKTLKALIGPGAAFAGDHVELSDGGDDFASTVGIGAIVSTKFTWPRDPKPKDSFLLTADRERLWRKWISLYNERQLPLGSYRGELYDIGFDRPETHVIEKSGRFYYAFYGHHYSGQVPLRGLSARSYRVRDYFNDKELGAVAGANGTVPIAFDGFLLLEAVPV